MSSIEIKLQRNVSTDYGTIGTLDADGLQLNTIEPPWRNNEPNRSCIPLGKYPVIQHRSPRYKDCLLVCDTAPRSFILFHAGNVGGDVEKGLHTHTHGCILPGLHTGWLTIRGRRQQAVLASRAAFSDLMDLLDGRNAVLTISLQ